MIFWYLGTKKIRALGIEPRSSRWKRDILATVLCSYYMRSFFFISFCIPRNFLLVIESLVGYMLEHSPFYIENSRQKEAFFYGLTI